MRIELTPNAVTKVKEIMAQQNPAPAGLRVAVVRRMFWILVPDEFREPDQRG